MPDSGQKTTNQERNLSDELARLSREFAAFNSFYACYCDTLSQILVAGQPLDAGTVEGVNRCSQWMKYRMSEIGKRLEALQGTTTH